MLNELKYPIRSMLGFTAVLSSIVAVVVLVFRATSEGTLMQIVAFSIYGVSLITLWSVSTLYHSLNVSNAVNRTLEQLDHAMIYFLIAGTYTPICLIVLKGAWGWSLFATNWTLAISGIILKLVVRQPPKWLDVILFSVYMLMGWLVLLAWYPLTHALSHDALFLLLLGGILYTVGAVFFYLRFIIGAHEIWHIFAMTASACHYWFMLNYALYLK